MPSSTGPLLFSALSEVRKWFQHIFSYAKVALLVAIILLLDKGYQFADSALLVNASAKIGEAGGAI